MSDNVSRLPDALTLMRETAIEMYVEEGNSIEKAKGLAEQLLHSPTEFDLPKFSD